MIKGIIFDLDGVLVSTDDLHYRAWKRLADECGIYFDRKINDRLRGVSRMESLEIILERADHIFSQDEKVKMAENKNGYYRDYIQELSSHDLLPGVLELLNDLKLVDIKTAIGSSSCNASLIMEKTGLLEKITIVVDGNDIKNSKPDPEVFLLAAERMGLLPEDCLVFEDALSGVVAAVNAGMKVWYIGNAAEASGIDKSSENLVGITAELIRQL